MTQMTTCDLHNNTIIRLQAELSAAQAENARLREVIHWALGERGRFPDRPENWDGMKCKPWYWWRAELRQRFLAAIDAARKDGK